MDQIIKALDYGQSLIGIPYDYWKGGVNQTNAPMFAMDGPLPKKSEIVSANCAGLINLILRYMGKELPFGENGEIGGTSEYAYYYRNVAVPFDINSPYPKGTLVIRDYKNMDDQGHVAVLLDDGGKDSIILQSHVEGTFFESTTPGVNSKYTLGESHNGYYYELAVLPENWLL
jgi:hypothetical protein